MAQIRVTAPPNRADRAKVAGVEFVGGVGQVDDSTDRGKKALAYFRRRGYKVGADPVPKAVPAPRKPADKPAE